VLTILQVAVIFKLDDRYKFHKKTFEVTPWARHEWHQTFFRPVNLNVYPTLVVAVGAAQGYKQVTLLGLLVKSF